MCMYLGHYSLLGYGTVEKASPGVERGYRLSACAIPSRRHDRDYHVVRQKDLGPRGQARACPTTSITTVQASYIEAQAARRRHRSYTPTSLPNQAPQRVPRHHHAHLTACSSHTVTCVDHRERESQASRSHWRTCDLTGPVWLGVCMYDRVMSS